MTVQAFALDAYRIFEALLSPDHVRFGEMRGELVDLYTEWDQHEPQMGHLERARYWEEFSPPAQSAERSTAPHGARHHHK